MCLTLWLSLVVSVKCTAHTGRDHSASFYHHTRCSRENDAEMLHHSAHPGQNNGVVAEVGANDLRDDVFVFFFEVDD